MSELEVEIKNFLDNRDIHYYYLCVEEERLNMELSSLNYQNLHDLIELIKNSRSIEYTNISGKVEHSNMSPSIRLLVDFR